MKTVSQLKKSSSSKPGTKSKVKHTTSMNLRSHWGLLLGLGVLSVFLGCIGLGAVVSLTLMSILFLGVVFLVVGVVQFIDAFKYRQWQGVIWHAIIALFYLVAGGLMMYDPILASALITVFIASILIVIGCARVMIAMSVRKGKPWGWLFFAGMITIALGVFILVQWPISALWVIGLFIAIELIMNGFSCLFIALAMRR